MCSVKLLNILEALSNALAEVIPKLMIRQFLRAMHVFKRRIPSVMSPRVVSFVHTYFLLARPRHCSKCW